MRVSRLRFLLVITVASILYLTSTTTIVKVEPPAPHDPRWLSIPQQKTATRCTSSSNCAYCPDDIIKDEFFLKSSNYSRANAVITILCRNSEIDGIYLLANFPRSEENPVDIRTLDQLSAAVSVRPAERRAIHRRVHQRNHSRVC
jgi:hypothetical protein